MAYLVGYSTQSNSTAVTTVSIANTQFPEFAVDDVLVVAILTGASSTYTVPSGWTQIGSTTAMGGTGTGSVAIFYKKATAITNTMPSTTITSNRYHAHIFVIRDVDTSTQIDVSTLTGSAAASEFSSPSVTTTTADCFVLYYNALDTTGTSPVMCHSDLGAACHFIDSSDNGGATTNTNLANAACGWYIQRTAGATPTPSWTSSVSEPTVRCVIAFRNKSGGVIPAYIDDSATLGQKLIGGHHWASATTLNNTNFPAALTITYVGPDLATTSASGTGSVATIGFATQVKAPFYVGQTIAVAGITPAGYNNAAAVVTACTTSSVSYANATTGAQTVAGTLRFMPTAYDVLASAGDAGLNAYSNAVSSSPAMATATSAGGWQCNFPTTSINMTDGWVVSAMMASTAKMAGFQQRRLGSKAIPGGWFMAIGDATYQRTFHVMGQDNADGNGAGFSVMSVRPNQTQTMYGWQGTAPTISTITRIFFGHIGGAPGASSNGAFYWMEVGLAKKIIVAGGTSTSPVNSAGIETIGKYARIPLVKRMGAAEIQAYVPVQIGGGDAVYFEVDAGALQFPRIADETYKECNYHGADGDIGISYAGKSGDTIKHTNSVVTSASPYYWEINSAATNAATWDFSGLTVVKANVTLRAVMTFTNMAFSSCAYVATTGSTVTSCKFSNTLVTCSSPANAALISSSTFTKTTGTQHGIEISGTAADMTLSGVTFTGYAGTNGSTGNEAIYVNIAIGNMTINITNGGSTPSIRTAGATVTVQNAVTVTVTVKDASSLAVIENARVLMEKVSDGTDIMTGLTNASGVITTTYAYTVDTAVTGNVRRASAGYGTLYKPNVIAGTITSSGLSVTILLTSDE